ncbi:hypothetical protein BD779DRAFT_1680938 [Infundibulicybe gibba]|nr:hypothetical protein BD779DRAFT_1680938 [Infundibulicybe gibba]
MPADSDSDISVEDDDITSLGRGKRRWKTGVSKIGDPNRRKDKAKAKPKDVVRALPVRLAFAGGKTASVYLGGVVHSLVGDGTGSRKLTEPDGRVDGKREAEAFVRSSFAIRRTIIRLLSLLDLPVSITDCDTRSTRFDLTLQYTCRSASRACALVLKADWEMSGIPQDVLRAIAAGSMKYVPILVALLKYGPWAVIVHLSIPSLREIIIIFGSMTKCDPGNMYVALAACVDHKIRISVAPF